MMTMLWKKDGKNILINFLNKEYPRETVEGVSWNVSLINLIRNEKVRGRRCESNEKRSSRTSWSYSDSVKMLGNASIV